jgi:filamentous hemagglutinin family protein
MKKKMIQAVLVLIFALISASFQAEAEHPRGIQLDGSVGGAGALELSGPGYEIKADYGHQAGGNLFHSFLKFNLHSDETAVFSGPDSVQHIISRVTGGQYSWIDGKISSGIAGADLYLLNPSGFIFGPHASLDVTGSFHAAASSYLRLGGNDRFYASLGQDDVLSAAPPAAFGFLNENPGPILVEGRGEISENEWMENPSGLETGRGETLSLIGGGIEIKKGTAYPVQRKDALDRPMYQQAVDESGIPLYEMKVDEWGFPQYVFDASGNLIPIYALDGSGNPIPLTDTIHPGDVRSAGGRIDMAAVAGPGEAVPSDSGLDVSSFDSLGDIGISNGAVVKNNGGDIIIRGGQLLLAGESHIRSDSGADSAGHAEKGRIDVQAGRIALVENSRITSDAMEAGHGADISVQAGERISISGGGIGTLASGLSYSAGNAGDVFIQSPWIELTDGGQIMSQTLGPGSGGNLLIRCAEALTASGADISGNVTSGVRSSSFTMISGAGNAGRIEMDARGIALTDAAQIKSDTYGSGGLADIIIRTETFSASGINDMGVAGGIVRSSYSQEMRGEQTAKIDITADEFSLTQGAQIAWNAYGMEDAGSIAITARNLSLSEGGSINSTTWASGKGGVVSIISDTLSVSWGGGIFSDTKGGTGDAGGIDIHTRELTLKDGAGIGTITYGYGKGGPLNITADEISLTASVISGAASGSGDAGPVDISARKASLTKGSQISSGTKLSGSGSDLHMRIADTLTISGMFPGGNTASGIYGSAEGVLLDAGNAGDIRIEAGRVEMTEGGQIVSHSLGPGQGGNIFLDVKDTLKLSGKVGDLTISGISADSSGTYLNPGDAGDIDIHARSIEISDGAQIANGPQGAGDGGEIRIKADETLTLSAGLISATTHSTAPGAGDAGQIDVQARQIHISNGGQINCFTLGPGKGGEAVIHADDLLKISGRHAELEAVSGIFSTSDSPETDGGSGGKISISGLQVVLENEGSISTSSAGGGAAGDVSLTVGSLSLKDRARVSSESKSEENGGAAGLVAITASGSVNIQNGGSLTTEALGAGGGRITVNAGDRIYLLNGDITSSVKQGAGNGGDVATDSNKVILNHSRISANAEEGDGGAIFIKTGNYLKSVDSQVTATSKRGNQGTVEIVAPDLDVSSGLTVLPGNFMDASKWMQTPCGQRSAEAASHFYIQGRDAVPPSYHSWASSPPLSADEMAAKKDGPQEKEPGALVIPDDMKCKTCPK